MINAGKNRAQRAGVYVRQPQGYRAFIPKPLPPNPPVQVNRLFDHPIVTVATVREWLGITPAGANQIVSRLEGIGLLQEITGAAHNRRFRFEPTCGYSKTPGRSGHDARPAANLSTCNPPRRRSSTRRSPGT